MTDCEKLKIATDALMEIYNTGTWNGENAQEMQDLAGDALKIIGGCE